MADEWQITTVGELLAAHGGEIKTGPFGTKLKAAEYAVDGVGVPVISVGEVDYGRLHLHEKTPRVGPSVTERMPEYLLCEGDIVFGRKGAVDRCARVRRDQAGWFLGSDGIRLRLPQSCSSAFVSYAFQTAAHRQWMLQHAAGSTMASLNEGIIRRIPVTLPSLDEQQAIACILGALDDKIELNRRRNRTLEAMARAIFQSWFVDFDPVKAKAAGRTPPGLSPALAALFPDRFEDSPLGPIPAGWRAGCILEIADLLSGGTPKTSEPSYWDGEIPWASAKDVSQCGEAFLIDTERTITPQGLENSATQMIAAFSSVVVARGATTGRMTMFGHDIAMNQTCYALKSKSDTPRYLYLLLRHEIDAIVHTAHGSVFDTITTATFRASKVCIATPELVREFEMRVSPMFDQILGTLRQSRTLAALRDALLPKLISGELRVPDAERIVGRAT